MAPTIISDHAILGRIGAGGMGEVFLAEDTRLRRKVALKFLSDRFFEDEAQRARFLREARNAAALNHPNICTIFRVAEVETDVTVAVDPPCTIRAGTPFLAMELVEGRTLDRVIRDTGPLPVGRLLDLARQIASGLAEAHRHSIVHRDLKPQNIMQTEGGGVKILDFGLAKSVGPVGWGEATTALDSGEPTVLTGQGTVVGTPAYMSPEQALGKEVGPPSDIFSFGLILSELATGKRVYRGQGGMEILARIIHEEPEPLTRSDLPAALITIRDRCLSKEPGARFADGGELETALRSVEQAGDEAVVATQRLSQPGSTPQSRPRLRGRWLPALAAVVVLATVGTLWLRADHRPGGHRDPTLAVLPFTFGGPENDAYLAQGVTEEVTNRMALLRDLNVVSSTSARAAHKEDRNPAELAKSLGATHLLEGALNVNGSRVRVTCRLLDSKGSIVWNAPGAYEAPRDSLFDLQSRLAEDVARALSVKVIDPVRAARARPPTRSAAAYQDYLKGIESTSDYTLESAQKAVTGFAQAVEEDPGFALAWAHLSMALTWEQWTWLELTPEQIAFARTAADTALQLAPDLPEAHLARGYYLYRIEDQPDQALQELNRARQAMPNNSDLLFAVAAVERRQGKIDASIGHFTEAVTLDPRSRIKSWETGETLRFDRRFREAESYYDRAIGISPGFTAAYNSKAELELLGEADTLRAAGTLRAAALHAAPDEDTAWLRIACAIFRRDFREALALANAQSYHSEAPRLLFRVWIHDLDGDTNGKRAAADSLRDLLQAELKEFPDDPNVSSILGLAHAALGDRARAVELGERALDLASGDAILASEMRFQLAWIHLLLDDPQGAYPELERLLGGPSWLTRKRLALDPTFDKFRGSREFRSLMAAPSS